MSTSFAANVKPMFTVMDRNHMLGAFDLWDYDDVKKHASDIYRTVEEGSMPPPDSGEARWTPEMVARFKNWTDQGYPS